MSKAKDVGAPEGQEWEFVFLDYLFPIVVTAGPIFTVEVTTEVPEVNQVRWARLKRAFKSEALAGDLRADIVAFDNLHEYLEERVLRTFDSAKAAIKNNVHLYDPTWLKANLGEPREPQNKAYFNRWLGEVQRNRKK